MTSFSDMPPPDPTDTGLILHRLGQLEAHSKVIFEVRDAVRDLAVEVRLSKGAGCPAPGKCLELERDLRAHDERIVAVEKSITWAKGATAGLGLLGTANLVGLLVQIFGKG